MKRFITTNDDLQAYKSLCEKWLSALGIKSYLLSFERTKLGRSMAAINADASARNATFKLSTSWHKEITMEELEKCALHECVHLLLADLIETAEKVASLHAESPLPLQSLLENHLSPEEEAVVVTLEKVLFEESHRQPAMPKASKLLYPENGYWRIILKHVGNDIIKAIKAVRTQSNLGLTEAKDLVDSVRYGTTDKAVVAENVYWSDTDRYICALQGAGCEVAVELMGAIPAGTTVPR